MRMVLRGDTPVRHAFDGDSGVCVVPLRLSLRNCLPQTASLSIEAGLTVEASQRDGAHAGYTKRLERLPTLQHTSASVCECPPWLLAHARSKAQLVPCC